MKKFLILFFLFFCGLSHGFSTNREQARNIVINFLKNKKMKISDISLAEVNSDVIIFNNGQNDGFVVVANNPKLNLILGYTEKGHYDTQDSPCNFNYWKNHWQNQLLHFKNTIKLNNNYIDTKKTILPLLKTKWDQYSPYNNLCPEMNGKICPTGCTVTAMAQIMKYYKYPNRCESLYGYVTNSNRIIMPTLQETEFKWDNMLDVYGKDAPEEYVNEISKLMLYCGYAVYADYDSSGTGASTMDAFIGFRQLFDYSVECKYIYQKDYDEEEWNNLIYNNLEQGFPVLYSGLDESGEGHAFICDGYDNEYFHINWGWGGKFDGYFILSLANPYTNSYEKVNDGFRKDQEAIINLMPNNWGKINTIRIPTDSMTEKKTVYSITGQFVGQYTSFSNLPKGIYLVNGKKIAN